MSRLKRSVYISLHCALLLIIFIGCTPAQTNVVVEMETEIPAVALPTSQPRPGFIHNVSPLESSEISLSLYEVDRRDGYATQSGIYIAGALRVAEIGYNKTVCVELGVESLVQSGDDLTTPDSVLERIQLSVDNVRLSQVVDQDSLLELISTESATWSGPYTFCWLAELGLGDHHAVFQFRQASGVIHEYDWYFAIVPNAASSFE
jgi:hypothetical protein